MPSMIYMVDFALVPINWYFIKISAHIPNPKNEQREFFYFRASWQCETSLCRPGTFHWFKNQSWIYSPWIGTWSYGFDAQILTLFMTKKVIPLILSFTLSLSYYFVRLKHLNVRAHQIVVWLHERLGNISLVNLMYRILTKTLIE